MQLRATDAQDTDPAIRATPFPMPPSPGPMPSSPGPIPSSPSPPRC